MQIYGIGIYESGASRGRTPEELPGPEMLRDLSEPTGGRHFVVENLSELPDVAAKIGIELRNQYMIGYSPSNEARDGKYRKIQVKIIQPRGLPTLRATWRTGRFAPQTRKLLRNLSAIAVALLILSTVLTGQTPSGPNSPVQTSLATGCGRDDIFLRNPLCSSERHRD